MILERHICAYRNKLLGINTRRGIWNRDAAFAASSLLTIAIIFLASAAVFAEISARREFTAVLPEQLLRFCLFGFLVLLICANTIAAMNLLFSAKDFELLLYTPTTLARIYLIRLSDIIINSSLLIVLYAVPVLCAYSWVFSTSWHFVVYAAIVVSLLSIIAAVFALSLAIFLGSLLPTSALYQTLLFFSIACLAGVLGSNESIPARFATTSSQFPEITAGLSQISAANTLTLLLATALSSLAGGYLLFHLLFPRLRNKLLNTAGYTRRSAKPFFSASAVLCLLPAQLRAFAQKEMRMLLRDWTQAMQLISLLALTLIYMYNFRALSTLAPKNEQNLDWWRLLLNCANIFCGGSILAALSARFVFPSVSLEGSAINLIRAAPLSNLTLLKNKFILWLFPLGTLAMLLFLSGGFIVFAPAAALVVTAAFALAISWGVVGLGVGLGAVFAVFDWESHSQIVSSLGNIIYLICSLLLMGLSALPIAIVYTLTIIPALSSHFHYIEYHLALFLGLSSVFALNFWAAKLAICCGVRALDRREL